MKSQIYNQAKYYEIAFSFVDSEKQADLFEKFIKKYSKTGVKSVLDLACGTALQLREMAKRGYKSIGLDTLHILQLINLRYTKISLSDLACKMQNWEEVNGTVCMICKS